MLRPSAVVLGALLSVSAGAAEKCEAPRFRSTDPLAAAAAQDRQLAAAFERAAGACAERGEACDQARQACAATLAATASRQSSLDDGVWLRDLLLPFMGQRYPLSRPALQTAPASDSSCQVDGATLGAAGQRRLAQADRREGLVSEYQGYVAWAKGESAACEERAATQLKAEQAQAAAAAEARQRQDAELAARGKAEQEESARLKAAGAATSAAALAAQQGLSREQQLQDQRFEQDQQVRKEQGAANQAMVRERQEAQAREKDARAAEKRDAEAAAKALTEEQKRQDRLAGVAAKRALKRQMVTDAETRHELALLDEKARKQAAVDAVRTNPSMAQSVVAEAAAAERARLEAERGLAEARLRADRMEIDDSFERSRGHVGLAVGGGGTGWAGGATGVALGAQITAHFGFWGPAPLSGLSSGFELGLLARYSGPLGANLPPAAFDALVTGRYFFGFLGVGLAAEVRLPGYRSVGAGPSLGLAILDTPHARVLFNAHWMPLGTAVDGARLVGELDVSWEWLTVRVTGGPATDSLPGGTQVSWQASLFVGARLSW